MKKSAPKQTTTASTEVPILWKYCQDPAMGVWVACCETLKLTVQAPSYPALLGCLGEAMAAVLSVQSDGRDAAADLHRSGRCRVTRRAKHCGSRPDWAFPVTTMRVSPAEMMPPPDRGFVAGNH